MRFTQFHEFVESWGNCGGITFFVGIEVAVKHTSMVVMISSVVKLGENTENLTGALHRGEGRERMLGA